MPKPGERLGFNLVHKKCSPQNYKRGGVWVGPKLDGWVLSKIPPPPLINEAWAGVHTLRSPLVALQPPGVAFNRRLLRFNCCRILFNCRRFPTQLMWVLSQTDHPCRCPAQPPPFVIPHPLQSHPSLSPKSIGNTRRQRHRRKFFFGYTGTGVGGDRHLVTPPPKGWSGTELVCAAVQQGKTLN